MFCAITGASQGLGQAIAVTIAKTAPKESYFVLAARNEQGLQKTKSLMLEQRQGDDQQDISVDIRRIDLSTNFQFSTLFQQAEHQRFTNALLINNAGSLGNVSASVIDYTDADEVRRYYDFNMASPICLTSAFLKIFSKREQEEDIKCTVVNISSLAAIQPFPSMGNYCAGKAGRDMVFHVLALEEPNVRVLNYSPGPLQGDMAKTLRTKLKDEKGRNLHKSLYEKDQLVSMFDSASKLAQLLKDDRYESGAHVDYYDELP